MKISIGIWICIFIIILSNSYSIDIIDMRDYEPENETLLFNNYIQKINQYELVKPFASYYDNILITIDNYNMTIYFNDYGIEKIVEKGISNPDYHLIIDKQTIYIIVEIMKGIIHMLSLDIEIGDLIHQYGI